MKSLERFRIYQENQNPFPVDKKMKILKNTIKRKKKEVKLGLKGESIRNAEENYKAKHDALKKAEQVLILRDHENMKYFHDKYQKVKLDLDQIK